MHDQFLLKPTQCGWAIYRYRYDEVTFKEDEYLITYHHTKSKALLQLVRLICDININVINTIKH